MIDNSKIRKSILAMSTNCHPLYHPTVVPNNNRNISMPGTWSDTSIPHQRHFIKLDLIVDVYIDPITERHMTLNCPDELKVSCNDTDERALDDKSTTLLEKKRFRLSQRQSGTPQPEEFYSHGDNQEHHIAENNHINVDGTTCKRIKHNSTERNDWNRIIYTSQISGKERNRRPYPRRQDVDQALDGCCRDVSQLLACWDSPPPALEHDQKQSLKTSNDGIDWPDIDDVQVALLGFHVTSDDGQNWDRQPVTQQNYAYQPENQEDHDSDAPMNDNFGKSNSSLSLSSLSYLDQQTTSPPTLLRITTSSILEEQNLIWKQIQSQIRHDNITCNNQSNANSTWNHEVTRSHGSRPPLSPSSRTVPITTTQNAQIDIKVSSEAASKINDILEPLFISSGSETSDTSLANTPSTIRCFGGYSSPQVSPRKNHSLYHHNNAHKVSPSSNTTTASTISVSPARPSSKFKELKEISCPKIDLTDDENFLPL